MVVEAVIYYSLILLMLLILSSMVVTKLVLYKDKGEKSIIMTLETYHRETAIPMVEYCGWNLYYKELPPFVKGSNKLRPWMNLIGPSYILEDVDIVVPGPMMQITDVARQRMKEGTAKKDGGG